MSNLTRYDLEIMGQIIGPPKVGMVKSELGAFVKFDDIKEFLKPSHNTGSLKLLAELDEWVSKSASMYVYPNSDLARRVREQLQAGA